MRKLLSTALVLGVIGSTSILPAFADIAVDTLPKLDSAINADVTTNGSNMNVQINAGQGGVGTINWGSFNVGKDAGVNYEFTAHNQTALNKVDAAGGLSQIYGQITSSGCSGCGYDATGKVILINPNGVLFGDGANVNLNSFTVSTMNGTFDANKNELQLDRNGATSKYGILVEDGAKIYADKGVTFASDNVSIYNGSKISTNIGPNSGDASFGKIKIVTSDGVNFSYYNNGAVKEVSGIKGATDKMVVSVNGELESGNIDIRNYSSNVDSEINLNGAALKATKAVEGNDGNIWLTASNKVVVDNSNLTTANYSDAAAANEGGNIRILAGNKASVTASKLNSVGKVEVIAQNGDSVIDNTTITAAKDVDVTAGNRASIQKNSTVKGNNVNVVGTKRSQVNDSTIEAIKDVNIASVGDMVWTANANIKAGNDVNAIASNGYLLLNDSILSAKNDVNLISKDSITSTKLAGSTLSADKNVSLQSTEGSVLLTSTSQFVPKETLNLTAAKNVEINETGDLITANTNITAGKNVFLTSSTGSVNVDESTKFNAAEKIYIQAKNDVNTTGKLDLNNIQTNILAGRDVNATLANVGDRNNDIVAKAGNDMTITTDGDLAVSSLISGNNMTLNAKRILSGNHKTSEFLREEGDSADRAYIEVGGEFKSNPDFEVTDSADRTNDGYYKRHHIQYEDGTEKILLINKRPVNDQVEEPNVPGINNGEEVDVINPGNIPDDEEETPGQNPDVPGQNPDVPGQNPDDPGQNPDDPGQTPDDPEECPDIPNDDEVQTEDEPELNSAITNTLSTINDRNSEKNNLAK